MRTRRQGKQNLIVIFQRITTKDIKGNKKGTSTNPKPKILFLFFSFFFFPSSPVPHFSAALVIPSLNFNIQPPTTECILTQLPMKTSRPWNPGWPDAWKAWLKLLLGLANLTRYSNTFKKIYIPGPAPRTRFGPNSPLRPSRTDPDPYRVDPRTITMKQAIARDKRWERQWNRRRRPWQRLRRIGKIRGDRQPLSQRRRGGRGWIRPEWSGGGGKGSGYGSRGRRRGVWERNRRADVEACLGPTMDLRRR